MIEIGFFVLMPTTYLSNQSEIDQGCSLVQEYGLTLLSPIETARVKPDGTQMVFKFSVSDEDIIRANLNQYYPNAQALTNEEMYAIVSQEDWNDPDTPDP